MPWRFATIEHMFYVWHSVYDAFYSPDVPKGVMVMRERAATSEDRAAADRVCAQLNADNPRMLDTMVDPWVVTDDRGFM
jgi:hypothetical protein